MTLIAVTQRTEYLAEYKEERDSIDQRWHDFFAACNITPVFIPNHPRLAQNLVEKISFQGVLLTGGNDTPKRNATEQLLFQFAMHKKLPVIGVCHGMQFIQKAFGLELQKLMGHVVERQEIWINGATEEVNSYHHFGTVHTVPELRVWAKARDGVIKAIQHNQLPITGIMWHPERCYPFKTQDIKLIKNIFVREELMCKR